MLYYTKLFAKYEPILAPAVQTPLMQALGLRVPSLEVGLPGLFTAP
jgi:hypothetical protein